MKLHYPAEFTAALLNAQPMGFYSPHTIVRDARRHGVEVLGPDVNISGTQCSLEPRTDNGVGRPLSGNWHADESTMAVRIGLRYVRNVGDGLLERIEAERAKAPFADLEDFARRTAAPTDAIEGLATAGAFGFFDLSRRDALWAAAALREARPDKLPGLVTGLDAPALPAMTAQEEAAADLWSMGLSPAAHPTEFTRAALAERGVLTIAGLADVPHRAVVEVAGVVTHRQRPGTARGVIFINLEDETGLLNVICSPGVWRRHRRVARTSSALLVRGVLERHQGVVNLVAHRLAPLPAGAAPRSRDFR
jgi:error-prone DNA polymerase